MEAKPASPKHPVESGESRSGGEASASKERKSRVPRLTTPETSEAEGEASASRLPVVPAGSRMIRVSIEVGSGDSTFIVAAEARSIERALNAVKAVYGTNDAKVLFPVEPESFFVERGAEARVSRKSGASVSLLPK